MNIDDLFDTYVIFARNKQLCLFSGLIIIKLKGYML